MKTKTTDHQQHAISIHRQSLVVDMHSDVHLDVIRQRGLGRKRVLETRHLPKWQKGHVDVVILNQSAQVRSAAIPLLHHTGSQLPADAGCPAAGDFRE